MSGTSYGGGSHAGLGTLGVGVDDLVTGEAVALDLPPAGLAMRVVSGVIDIVATMVVLWGASFVAVLATANSDEAVLATGMLLASVLVLVVAPTTLETLTRGRSLGKLALGLRTVRDDAGPITFRHAFTRALVGVVEVWVFLGIPALIAALVTDKGKRLGDMAAGTYVVRERVRMTLPPPPAMPLQLEAWARGADIARLPDGLALAVRQFLMRAPTLSPAARASLGGQLHDEVLAYVAPPPPRGTPPEALLAAVVADRRRRDTIRLDREAGLRARLVPPDPLAVAWTPAPPHAPTHRATNSPTPAAPATWSPPPPAPPR